MKNNPKIEGGVAHHFRYQLSKAYEECYGNGFINFTHQALQAGNSVLIDVPTFV